MARFPLLAYHGPINTDDRKSIMTYRLQLLPLLILLLAATTGCQTIDTIKEKQTIHDLEKTLYAYENTIRWGNLENAYAFLEPEIAAQTRIPTGLDNIRVTSYEVIKKPVLMDENTASQTAKISYVLQDRQVERNVIDNQTWRRKEGTKLWYRATPIMELK